MTRSRGLSFAAVVALAISMVIPAVGTGQSPSPAELSASATPSLVPPVVPLRLRRSASAEQDGIRVRIELDRNPMPAGRPLTARLTVKNVGRDTVTWQHDSCATPVHVRGEMVGVSWRPGEPAGPTDYTGLKWRASEWWVGGNPAIRLMFWPGRYVGQGEYACADVAMASEIPPGRVLRRRAVWDGMAYHRLGPPPDGRARITATFDSYRRPSLGGGFKHAIEVSLDAWVMDGRDPAMLHPMEIVDAALADPAFAAWVDAVEIGNASDQFIQYDPEADLWEVGVYFNRGDHFVVALVDPRTGSVEGVIDRPRGPDEPYP
jgi:hypothetical protein